MDPTERSGGPTVLLVVTEVRDSGVCSGHWTVVRDINDKRLRDDEDDDPGAGQSPRVGEPSSSSKRLLKRKNPELVESEGQKEFASERRHCGRESFPWQCRRIQNQPRMTVSHDSLAGSSGDSMRNIVGIVHFAESTIRQYMRAANDISHEATSSITHTKTHLVTNRSQTLCSVQPRSSKIHGDCDTRKYGYL